MGLEFRGKVQVIDTNLGIRVRLRSYDEIENECR